MCILIVYCIAKAINSSPTEPLIYLIRRKDYNILVIYVIKTTLLIPTHYSTKSEVCKFHKSFCIPTTSEGIKCVNSAMLACPSHRASVNSLKCQQKVANNNANMR